MGITVASMNEAKPAHNEREAADLVASVVRGSPHRRDTGDVSDRHDYDIVMDDGSVTALEITRHTSQADHEFQGILDREKKRDWRFPRLRDDYSIAINTPAGGKRVGKRIHDLLKQLRREAPALLEEVEQTDADVTFIRPRGPVTHLQEKLRALHIIAVYHIGPAASQDGGMVYVEPWFPPGSAGDEIPAAAEHHIGRKAAKLVRRAEATGASEAHLFVWLEPGPHSQAPVAVMAAGRSPTRVPELCGLDAVWVAIYDGDNPRTWGMWRCTPAEGWTLINFT